MSFDVPQKCFPPTGKWEVRKWYHSASDRNLLVLVAPNGKTDMNATFDSDAIGVSEAYATCGDRNQRDGRTA
jgi:hypothetical protein